MKIIFYLILLCPLISFAGVDFLIGMDAGHIDFEDQRPTEKEEYTSINIGFHLASRFYLSLGSVELGLSGSNSWNDMNLLKDISSGSDNSYSHLYYGAFLGLRANEKFRLNLEYYTYSNHEILWAEGKSSNYFTKGDYIRGTGVGIGATIINGPIFYEMMFQAFHPKKLSISDAEFDSGSDGFEDENIKSVRFSYGIKL